MEMTQLETLRALCQLQIDTLEWLEQCPQPNADGIYETVGTLMDEQKERIVLLSLSVGDEALTESIRGFVDEGELPMLPNGEQAEEQQFWAAITSIIDHIGSTTA
jgi:hypothetical protein